MHEYRHSKSSISLLPEKLNIQTFYNQLFQTKITQNALLFEILKKPPKNQSKQKDPPKPERTLHLRWHYNMKMSHVFADMVPNVKQTWQKLLQEMV